MKINLKTFANLRDIIGGDITVELGHGAKLSDLFDYLDRHYGEKFSRQVRDQITKEIVPFLILVNDTTYRSTFDMDTPLNDGDEVTIMIPFDGG